MNPPKYSKILAAVGVSMALVGSASAATIFNVNFESPNYTVGQQYSITGATGATTNLPVLGAPGDLSQMAITTTTGNTLTATVTTSGPTGNALVFANSGTGAIAGTIEAFAPGLMTGGTTGTWFAQMDYTRLSSIGGPLLSMRLANSVGQLMLGHPNNQTVYADAIIGSPNFSLAVGATNTLRVEIDMGTVNWRMYINGGLFQSNINAANDTAGASFGGLQLGFNYGTSYAAGNLFALDNIQVGSVPEPSTFGLLALGGLALAAFRRRRQG